MRRVSTAVWTERGYLNRVFRVVISLGYLAGLFIKAVYQGDSQATLC
jgi:hypothetical protein